MNNKYGSADLIKLIEFERLLNVSRARRQRICTEHNIQEIDIGVDTRQVRITKQQVINLYNKCIVYKPKQAGQPRSWGDLKLLSFAELRNKFNLSSPRLKNYCKFHKIRILNICGSNRVPACDIRRLLSNRATIPSAPQPVTQ